MNLLSAVVVSKLSSQGQLLMQQSEQLQQLQNQLAARQYVVDGRWGCTMVLDHAFLHNLTRTPQMRI